MCKGDSATHRILGIVANKWTVSVIRRLGEGSKRPSELMHSIKGISQNMLTQTLRGMERGGLVTREVFATVPPRVEYTLTPFALTLVEPIEVFHRWAREHRAEIEAWESQPRSPAARSKKLS